MLKLQGANKIVTNLRNVRMAVMARLEADIFDTTQEWYLDTVDRLTYPFQTVMSYVYESRLGLPGRKKYPSDAVGVFSTKEPDVTKGPFGTSVQEYITGTHVVADKLKTSISVTNGVIEASLGYSENDENAKTGKIVRWILFGTEKMQARNYLQSALDRVENQLPLHVTRSVEDTLNNVVLE
jgi:hypothetical protein